MPTYSREVTLPVSSDTAFAYLSDVENLPRYFPRITEARPQDGNEVAVTAVVDAPGEEPRTESGEAWFRADAEARRITWGSEGHNDYAGELELRGDADASDSTLRLTLRTEQDFPAMDERIDETLSSIAARLTEDA